MNRRTISDLRVWICIRLQHSQVHPSHRIPRLFLKIFQRRLGGPVVWVPGQGNTIKSSNIVSVAQGLQHSQAHPSFRITRRFLRYLQRRLGDLWCESKANSSTVACQHCPWVIANHPWAMLWYTTGSLLRTCSRGSIPRAHQN